ncbi:MAG TPA: hypothetical protein VN578_08790 [Candidatus Binatia bacterium]|jgi:hypothetical protein|nr:hypothetical protein [Candidatus Binatia bacterium]
MRWWLARCRATLLLGALGLSTPRLPAAPQPDSPPPSASLAAREKEGCIKNLNQIYAAIQAYQIDHKDLPDWLSDLVPQYLADANLLVCPVCRRTGKTEAPPLADPNIPTSYLFEFCPVPLPGSPNNPHTRREWKRRQMGLVGSVVPIVRCRHHDPVLNLAFDGRVYESPSTWEMALTNRIDPRDLTAARIFANESGPPRRAAARPPLVRTFAPRDTNAPSNLLDLTAFYNAMLTESWHGSTGNNLAELPAGLQTFAGVPFDVRGIVQLRSKSGSSTNFPPELKGIHVEQKCRRLHFLHAAGFGAVAEEGNQIGSYIIHFASNQMRLEIPIYYGQAVRNWHSLPDEPPPGSDLKVAWTGENAVSKKSKRAIRLFLTTWTNLVPDLEIDSIDFVSSMANPAPFLIAITAD